MEDDDCPASLIAMPVTVRVQVRVPRPVFLVGRRAFVMCGADPGSLRGPGARTVGAPRRRSPGRTLHRSQ